MIPADCDYYRAGSVGEALDLLATHADQDAELLAGGHGLVPSMKVEEASPDVLVDIDGIEDLRVIEADDELVTVGALARHADVAESEVLREHAPVVAEAAENVGDVQIRNRGTMGGNLAEANPAADLPAAVLAADATLAVRGRDGERTIDARDFFRGDGETGLERAEIVTQVRVPRSRDANGDSTAGAYVKKIHPASGYAMVGVAADVTVEGGEIIGSRVAANGVADRAIRLPAVEDALVGRPLGDGDAVAGATDDAAADLDPERLRGDLYASGEFRAQLLSTYARRAVETALDRATPGRSTGGDER
jgi:carbon-monoxide dehydrogenase medium subunit